jgi:hypothetical protein
MDPKIDSIAYIILFLIPGFIFQWVVRRYLALKKVDAKEGALEIMTASAFLHAAALPVFLYVVDLKVKRQLGVGLIVGLLAWPILAGFVWARISDSVLGEWMRRRLGANPGEPTAWSYFFGKRKAALVRAVLDDGSFVVGAFFKDSSASIPQVEDLYLEKQYVTDQNGQPQGLVRGTLGCWIPASRLRYLEFFDPQPKDDGNVGKEGSEETPTRDSETYSGNGRPESRTSDSAAQEQSLPNS